VNSKVMLGIAAVLLVAAGATAYWGMKLSAEPGKTDQGDQSVAEGAAPDVEQQTLSSVVDEVAGPQTNVIVLAHDMPKNRLITVDDLLVEKLRLAPPGSFSEVAAPVKKRLWRDLPAGTVLTDSSFTAGGPLARMIREDERAVTIQADEVISGGGFLTPGDFVDVLLYLKESERNADRTMQVVVPALRVLSVGEQLGLTTSGEPDFSPGKDAKDETDTRRREKIRTIILAVPETLLTRFSLASQVGAIRLAVRSAEEALLAGYYDGDAPEALETIKQQLFQFEKFALRQAKRPQDGLVPPRPKGVEVLRGSVVSREIP